MAEKTTQTDFLPGTYIVERPSPDRWDYCGPYGTTTVDDDCDVEIEADSYDTDPMSGSLRLWRSGAVIAVFRSWSAVRIKEDGTDTTD